MIVPRSLQEEKLEQRQQPQDVLQLDIRVGVSPDVDHEGGGGVDDQLGVPQLDDVDGLVGALPLLALSRSH